MNLSDLESCHRNWLTGSCRCRIVPGIHCYHEERVDPGYRIHLTSFVQQLKIPS